MDNKVGSSTRERGFFQFSLYEDFLFSFLFSIKDSRDAAAVELPLRSHILFSRSLILTFFDVLQFIPLALGSLSLFNCGSDKNTTDCVFHALSRPFDFISSLSDRSNSIIVCVACILLFLSFAFIFVSIIKNRKKEQSQKGSIISEGFILCCIRYFMVDSIVLLGSNMSCAAILDWKNLSDGPSCESNTQIIVIVFGSLVNVIYFCFGAVLIGHGFSIDPRGKYMFGQLSNPLPDQLFFLLKIICAIFYAIQTGVSNSYALYLAASVIILVASIILLIIHLLMLPFFMFVDNACRSFVIGVIIGLSASRLSSLNSDRDDFGVWHAATPSGWTSVALAALFGCLSVLFTPAREARMRLFSERDLNVLSSHALNGLNIDDYAEELLSIICEEMADSAGDKINSAVKVANGAGNSTNTSLDTHSQSTAVFQPISNVTTPSRQNVNSANLRENTNRSNIDFSISQVDPPSRMTSFLNEAVHAEEMPYSTNYFSHAPSDMLPSNNSGDPDSPTGPNLAPRVDMGSNNFLQTMNVLANNYGGGAPSASSFTQITNHKSIGNVTTNKTVTTESALQRLQTYRDGMLFTTMKRELVFASDVSLLMRSFMKEWSTAPPVRKLLMKATLIQGFAAMLLSPHVRPEIYSSFATFALYILEDPTLCLRVLRVTLEVARESGTRFHIFCLIRIAEMKKLQQIEESNTNSFGSTNLNTSGMSISVQKSMLDARADFSAAVRSLSSILKSIINLGNTNTESSKSWNLKSRSRQQNHRQSSNSRSSKYESVRKRNTAGTFSSSKSFSKASRNNSNSRSDSKDIKNKSKIINILRRRLHKATKLILKVDSTHRDLQNRYPNAQEIRQQVNLVFNVLYGRSNDTLTEQKNAFTGFSSIKMGKTGVDNLGRSQKSVKLGKSLFSDVISKNMSAEGSSPVGDKYDGDEITSDVFKDNKSTASVASVNVEKTENVSTAAFEKAISLGNIEKSVYKSIYIIRVINGSLGLLLFVASLVFNVITMNAMDDIINTSTNYDTNSNFFETWPLICSDLERMSLIIQNMNTNDFPIYDTALNTIRPTLESYGTNYLASSIPASDADSPFSTDCSTDWIPEDSMSQGCAFVFEDPAAILASYSREFIRDQSAGSGFYDGVPSYDVISATDGENIWYTTAKTNFITGTATTGASGALSLRYTYDNTIPLEGFKYWSAPLFESSTSSIGAVSLMTSITDSDNQLAWAFQRLSVFLSALSGQLAAFLSEAVSRKYSNVVDYVSTRNFQLPVYDTVSMSRLVKLITLQEAVTTFIASSNTTTNTGLTFSTGTYMSVQYLQIMDICTSSVIDDATEILDIYEEEITSRIDDNSQLMLISGICAIVVAVASILGLMALIRHRLKEFDRADDSTTSLNILLSLSKSSLKKMNRGLLTDFKKAINILDSTSNLNSTVDAQKNFGDITSSPIIKPNNHASVPMSSVSPVAINIYPYNESPKAKTVLNQTNTMYNNNNFNSPVPFLFSKKIASPIAHSLNTNQQQALQLSPTTSSFYPIEGSVAAQSDSPYKPILKVPSAKSSNSKSRLSSNHNESNVDWDGLSDMKMDDDEDDENEFMLNQRNMNKSDELYVEAMNVDAFHHHQPYSAELSPLQGPLPVVFKGNDGDSSFVGINGNSNHEDTFQDRHFQTPPPASSVLFNKNFLNSTDETAVTPSRLNSATTSKGGLQFSKAIDVREYRRRSILSDDGMHVPIGSLLNIQYDKTSTYDANAIKGEFISKIDLPVLLDPHQGYSNSILSNSKLNLKSNLDNNASGQERNVSSKDISEQKKKKDDHNPLLFGKRCKPLTLVFLCLSVVYVAIIIVNIILNRSNLHLHDSQISHLFDLSKSSIAIAAMVSVLPSVISNSFLLFQPFTHDDFYDRYKTKLDESRSLFLNVVDAWDSAQKTTVGRRLAVRRDLLFSPGYCYTSEEVCSGQETAFDYKNRDLIVGENLSLYSAVLNYFSTADEILIKYGDGSLTLPDGVSDYWFIADAFKHDLIYAFARLRGTFIDDMQTTNNKLNNIIMIIVFFVTGFVAVIVVEWSVRRHILEMKCSMVLLRMTPAETIKSHQVLNSVFRSLYEGEETELKASNQMAIHQKDDSTALKSASYSVNNELTTGNVTPLMDINIGMVKNELSSPSTDALKLEREDVEDETDEGEYEFEYVYEEVEVDEEDFDEEDDDVDGKEYKEKQTYLNGWNDGDDKLRQ